MDKQQQEPEQEPVEENAADSADAPQQEEAGTQDLEKMLQEAQARADEHWDQVVRARAELDNLKKRHERELESAHKYGLEKFVSELLSVWDSLELGYEAAKETQDIDKLLEGTELTVKMLVDAMNKFGVEQIDPKGEPFDPEKHQAMGMVPTDELPPNSVVEVIQKGYTLNGRLVRPALVMVSKAT